MCITPMLSSVYFFLIFSFPLNIWISTIFLPDVLDDMAFDPRTTAMKFWSRNEFYINQRTCPANSIHYLLQKYFILPSNKQHMEFMLKKNPDDYHQVQGQMGPGKAELYDSYCNFFPFMLNCELTHVVTDLNPCSSGGNNYNLIIVSHAVRYP
ncbi:unnamed protein product [Caretta caretta]